MKIQEEDLKTMLDIRGGNIPVRMKEKLGQVELNYHKITGKEKELAVLQNFKKD